MIRDRSRRPFSASEKFDFEMEFPPQEGFHPFPVFRAEAQTDAAIGAEMARHMNQFAVDAGAFDNFAISRSSLRAMIFSAPSA